MAVVQKTTPWSIDEAQTTVFWGWQENQIKKDGWCDSSSHTMKTPAMLKYLIVIEMT